MKIRFSTILPLLLTLLGVASFGNAQLQQRPRYKLHGGDQLKVEFLYTSDLNETVTIQPDGFIVLNSVGAVPVAGKTLDEATALIRTKASERLKDPVISVILTDFQKPYFIVAGQVPNPARYDLREQTTALKGLMLAGGVKNTGKETQVVVFHDVESGSPEVRVLNLKDVTKQSIFEHDMELDSGDIIFVPRTKLSRLSDLSVVASTFGLYLNAVTYAAFR